MEKRGGGMENKREKCQNEKCKVFKINVFWFIGILIIIIVTLVSLIAYIRRGEVVSLGDLISVSSGLVSIALAMFAIIYSISESIKTKTDSQRSTYILEKVKDGLDKSNSVLDEVKSMSKDVAVKVDNIEKYYNENKVSDFVQPIESIEPDAPDSQAKVILTKHRNTKVIKRGDIFYADLSPVIGSEQGGIRPVVIVQNDIANKYSPTVLVASITSQINKAKLPTHVEISSEEYDLNRDSVVLLEQMRTLDKRRIKEKIGHISDSDMKKINKSILIELSVT